MLLVGVSSALNKDESALTPVNAQDA